MEKKYEIDPEEAKKYAEFILNHLIKNNLMPFQILAILGYSSTHVINLFPEENKYEIAWEFYERMTKTLKAAKE